MFSVIHLRHSQGLDQPTPHAPTFDIHSIHQENMKFTFLLSLLASASAATKWHELTSDYSFAHYKAEFNKVYGPQENAEREAIFNQRLAQIKSHNSGSATWKTGVNRLTDATDAELNAMKVRPALASHMGKSHTPMV